MAKPRNIPVFTAWWQGTLASGASTFLGMTAAASPLYTRIITRTISGGSDCLLFLISKPTSYTGTAFTPAAIQRQPGPAVASSTFATGCTFAIGTAVTVAAQGIGQTPSVYTPTLLEQGAKYLWKALNKGTASANAFVWISWAEDTYESASGS